jgi:AcrR family transcriptional regulator
MTTTNSASRGARERARAELTKEIKEEARRQLAAHGAQGLSLRSVARELGMVSSALYRYFASRDELLTALIIDAYNALGEAAERAGASPPAADMRGRWRATCGAVRDWALANPHEYALIYGSPVPGYQAPQATIPSAVRVAQTLGSILAGADAGADAEADAGADALAVAAAGRSPRPSPGPQPLPPLLAEQTAIVADAIAPGVDGNTVVRGVIAWTQLFGMISFELFGQFANSLDPADEFFGYAIDRMADYIGLR